MKRKNNHIGLYKHLSKQELLEYHNGVLGNDEMYRLELHLNECELCSDALDGIALHKSPEVVFDTLNKEILPKKEKAFTLNYMAIAASISLIALFSLSYWLFTKSTSEQNIALNTPEQKQDVSEEVVSEADKVTALSEKSEEQIIDPVVDESAIVDSPTPTIASVEKESPKPEFDDKQKPIIANRAVQGAGKDVEEIDADMELAQEDESETIVEEIAEVTSDGQDNLGAVTQAAPSAARAAKKTSLQPSPTLKDQKEPTPIGGMNALKNHISSNLTYPKQAIDNKIKGTVVLEVTVFKNGAIKNIVVVKDVGYGCDAEATRLITVGPKWTPKVENGVAVEAKRQVKVKFKN